MTPIGLAEAEATGTSTEAANMRVETPNSLPKLAVPRLKKRAQRDDATGSLFAHAGVSEPGPGTGAAAAEKPTFGEPLIPKHKPATVGRWAVKKEAGPTPEEVAKARQRELALASVKPLRNDLSDADLELIEQQKPAAGVSPSAPEANEAAPGPAGKDSKAPNRWMDKIAHLMGR